MFEIDFENNTVIDDNNIDIKEEKLYNRNNVYLKLLNKRLKKFEYLDKYNINAKNFSSSDNHFLDNYDYSIIKHSDKYSIYDYLDKNETIILKQLLEKNLAYDKIFTNFYVDKHILPDQENYESLGKIKLRYMGFKIIKQLYESICNKKNDFDYVYCLDPGAKGYLALRTTLLCVFEVIGDNFDKKYIFYSSNSDLFYKTNELIKLDYIPIDNYELQLEIIEKYDFFSKYRFNLLDLENNYICHNKYFVKYTKYHYCDYLKFREDLSVYTRNIQIKGACK